MPDGSNKGCLGRGVVKCNSVEGVGPLKVGPYPFGSTMPAKKI